MESQLPLFSTSDLFSRLDRSFISREPCQPPCNGASYGLRIDAARSEADASRIIPLSSKYYHQRQYVR